MTIPALSVTCGDSSPKGRAKGLHSSTECLHVIRFGRTEPSAPTTVYRTCALSLPCHSEPVTDVTGVGIRPNFMSQRPKAATYLCRFAAKARFDNRHPQG